MGEEGPNSPQIKISLLFDLTSTICHLKPEALKWLSKNVLLSERFFYNHLYHPECFF